VETLRRDDKLAAMRVLLLNLNPETNELAGSALAGQGYEITTESGLTVDEVLALSPEVLVTEASPTDLSCCGMIAQLKARSDTRGSVRIVMVVRGGALERARALDLGADDVITFPFEALEFAARVRTQFRERQPDVSADRTAQRLFVARGGPTNARS